MLKLENSIRGLSFSRVAFDLTIQGTYIGYLEKKRERKILRPRFRSFFARFRPFIVCFTTV